MMTDTASRPFDVVLWGATGFTGRLVAEYLVRTSMVGVRFALGGRNRKRLEELRGVLSDIDSSAAELSLLVADASDPESLEAMVRQARVVCTTVGPFSRYGLALVAAAVRSNTHYCDITGEVPFIRGTIDAHHDEARALGVRIVHCCGFDSIPSDIGTLLLHHAAVERGAELIEVQLQVMSARGGFSGGTVASMLDMVEQAAHDRPLRRLLADPYALNPDGLRDGPDGADQMSVRFDPRDAVWTAPFVMAAINSRVVRRSNALTDFAYGRALRYSEVSIFKKGPAGAARAAALTAGLGAFVTAVRLPLTRSALRRWVLPAPGEGPSEATRTSGSFRIRVRATARRSDGSEIALTAIVADRRDPGYGSTAVMLAESALCLAFDELSGPGGVLTPATALGQYLVDRLRSAGMELSVTG